ncbi:MAG: glycosyltransferase [Dehalococcoidia bacterium]
MVDRVAPGHQLRICVLGDLDGVHTRAWLRYFVDRGHEVHGVSYYAPARPPEGVVVHALRPAPTRRGGRPDSIGARPSLTVHLGRRLPSSLQRFIQLLRYRRAGLRRTVEQIAPDVFHAHYLVEHGFYGTAANYHPYVVSAWGSDVLVEAANSRMNRSIARFALGRADLATANNRHMAREMVLRLGIERARVQHIVLGASRFFLERPGASVNARTPEPGHAPTVISMRSLDTPLYNIDVVVRALARVRSQVASVRLLIVGEGRLRPELERLVDRIELGDAVRFLGHLTPEQFRDALAEAEVSVSVPSSDATSVAVLEAMAVGCFPIVSDLPSQQELVEHGASGLRVPVRDEGALADAILRALEDREMRRGAVERNRTFVEEYGVLETNMARMEAWYYRLAGRATETPGATNP